MNHIVRILCACVVFAAGSQLVQAQSLVSTTPYHRIVVLEEFTGIHCGYCPDGHRLANALHNKMNQEPVIINIHSGGYAEPALDEPDFRTAFGAALDMQAKVAGYPAGTVNRHVFPSIDTVTSMGRGSWDLAAAELVKLSSPVNVGLHSTFNSQTRELKVDVEAYYTDNAPSPTNMLNVVLLENDVVAVQYDYTNGTHQDYHHMHMLRWMLSGQWGDSVLNTSKGTLVKRTYTYIVPSEFNIDNCDVAAFMAESNQEIYTGAQVAALGGTTQPVGLMSVEGPIAKSTATSQPASFALKMSNVVGVDETFTAEFISDVPSDWKIKGTLNGTEYSGAEFVISNGVVVPFTVELTPGASSGVGRVDVYLRSKNYPLSPVVRKTFYLMSGVENLLLSHPDALKYDSVYTRAMSAAGVNATGKMDRNIFEVFATENALKGLKSVYYNVSWAFPGITESSLNALKSLMDVGTHVLIAGQDFGWDIASLDTNAHATANSREFYKNYIHANFIADGGTTNSKFTAVGSDVLFKTVPTSVITAPYGASYFFPDQFSVIAPAKAIFNYNSVTSKVGALRYEAAYKLVYLGVGLEQLTPATGDAITSITKRWFAGEISSVEFDDLIAKGSSVYPNPASDLVDVVLVQPIVNGALRLYDVNGTMVHEQSLEQSGDRVRLQVSELPSGSYRLCVIDTQNSTISSSLLNIVR